MQSQEISSLNASREISLHGIWMVIKRHLVVIIIISALAGSIAMGISRFYLKPQFVSTAKLYVDASQKDKESVDLNALNYAQRVIETYIQMLDTNSFYAKVGEKLDPTFSASQIASKVSFVRIQNTEIFQLNVKTTDPNSAKLIADTIVDLAPQQIRELKGDATLKVVDPPTLPSKPSSPNTTRNTCLGLFIGLCFGLLYAFLREGLDQRIKSETDVTDNFDVQILGRIPIIVTNGRKKTK